MGIHLFILSLVTYNLVLASPFLLSFLFLLFLFFSTLPLTFHSFSFPVLSISHFSVTLNLFPSYPLFFKFLSFFSYTLSTSSQTLINVQLYCTFLHFPFLCLALFFYPFSAYYNSSPLVRFCLLHIYPYRCLIFSILVSPVYHILHTCSESLPYTVSSTFLIYPFHISNSLSLKCLYNMRPFLSSLLHSISLHSLNLSHKHSLLTYPSLPYKLASFSYLDFSFPSSDDPPVPPAGAAAGAGRGRTLPVPRSRLAGLPYI